MIYTLIPFEPEPDLVGLPGDNEGEDEFAFNEEELDLAMTQNEPEANLVLAEDSNTAGNSASGSDDLFFA